MHTNHRTDRAKAHVSFRAASTGIFLVVNKIKVSYQCLEGMKNKKKLIDGTTVLEV